MKKSQIVLTSTDLFRDSVVSSLDFLDDDDVGGGVVTETVVISELHCTVDRMLDFLPNNHFVRRVVEKVDIERKTHRW